MRYTYRYTRWHAWRDRRPYERSRLWLWLRERWIALTGTYTCGICGTAGLPLHADDIHHCEPEGA